MTDNGSPADANAASESAEEFPTRLRVHALARTLGLTSRQVLAHLADLGIETRSPQSSIDRETAEAVAARVREHVAVDESAAEAVDDAADTAGVAEPSAAEPSGGDAQADRPEGANAPTETSPEAAAEASASDSDSDTPTLFSAVDDTQHQPVRQTVEDVDAQPLFLSPQAVEAARRPSRSRSDSGDDSRGDNSSTDDTSRDDTSRDDTSGDDKSSRSEDGQADGERGSRRRRRGRRGRGRGRGDQGDGGNDEQASDDSTDNADNSTDNADDSDDDSRPSGKKSKKGKSDRSKSKKSDDDAKNQGADAGSGDKDGGDKDTGDKAGADADAESSGDADESASSDDAEQGSSKRRRRRRRRKGGADADADDSSPDDPPNTVVHEREPRSKKARDEVQGISGSTRLEAKRQRRRDGRDAGRRRPPILSESEFLARREAVDRVMVVRERGANRSISEPGSAGHDHAVPIEDYTQVAVLEDGVLVEHFVTTETSSSMVGNIYLGRVQNVLPGMEAAFVDIGRGRNGVLYAGEVNWDAAGLDGGSRKIEQALKPGDSVLVQVSKDPVGHKGARLTTQISLAGRYLVYVPGGSSTGISRKLPDVERKRLKSILGKLVPDDAGVIIRTASEGVSADELGADIARLEAQWKEIDAAVATAKKGSGSNGPKALYEEPDLLVRVVRDLFNEDFRKLVVEGQKAWDLVERYISSVAPDLMDRVERFEKSHADAPDSFVVHRIDEQLAKALDRKVWLPSGGTLIIEHTEAMTVVDVNTGKFTGSGGNLEETVTRNNLEAAEEIVRQMRLRDIGGMIIVDFIDMVLESNRDLVLRRLTEALARDRTRHQVSEVTSLGLVQMTRKRLGTGLLEAFSTPCTHCGGRGIIVHANPVEARPDDSSQNDGGGSKRSRRNRRKAEPAAEQHKPAQNPAEHPMFRAMAAHSHDHDAETGTDATEAPATEAPATEAPATESPATEARATEADATETATSVTETADESSVPDNAPSATTDQEGEAPTADAPSEQQAEEQQAPESEPAAPAPRRRRRVVRQAAAPPSSSEPVVLTGDGDAPSAPLTTFGPTDSAGPADAAVAVRRRPRRRTAGRPAGPPPGDQ
ncbi:translation initiation factor IF-2 N-terminal domain-containing protein [Gordonia sp. PKS22-38]|uniref:Translation initiation factor IF-2 N-terminal domain-containing protein n=1 Tax=Gordonia prachuapensis TaxID=3115651 RepID=A0ABU7MQS3_9ACTN|nr:translation initiation factor IF-2 N-terminal domain-containing protein [Gordonia sp. PKS22-38]